MSEPTSPVTPEPKKTRDINTKTLLMAIAGLLALIVLLLGWQTFAVTGDINQARDSNCTNISYGYVEDSEGDIDYDKPVKMDFSDLDAEERAQADLFDCDIKGR